MIILQGRQADLKRRRPCHLGAQTNIMPFSKRTYSFREGKVSSDGGHDTPLRKIKSRGRTFIGSRTPTVENTQEASSSSLTPFARSSIRLKSIRKRKMADAKSEENSFKRVSLKDSFWLLKCTGVWTCLLGRLQLTGLDTIISNRLVVEINQLAISLGCLTFGKLAAKNF